MGAVSAGGAIGAGFKVIGRTPWVVAAWALAYLVLALPQFAVLLTVLPKLVSQFQHLSQVQAAGAQPTTAEIFALQRQMTIVQLVSWITALVVNTILTGAIFRSVLQPQARRWAYLRLSSQELWLGLVSVVLLILLAIACFGVMLVAIIASAIVAGATHSAGLAAGAGLVIGLAVFAALLALTWAALRLSLALPMSFAERKLVLFEAWTLTRGNSLKVVLVALAVMAMVWIVELALIAVFWLGVGGLAHFDLASLTSLPPVEIARRILPFLMLLLPIAALVGMALLTVMVAPWAELYRQLRGDIPAAA